LVMEPEVILMDEPTSMLDPKGRNEIYNVIKKLIKMGETIIIASHQPSDLEEVDRIIALDKGEIIFDGLKEEFYSKNIIDVELPFKTKIEKKLNLGFEKLVDELCQ
ncbi:MAG: ABC transporter ATP-binding protein, partial [Patescibacteria group bacterium]